MAFFAVVEDPLEESHLEVIHCHVNIWILPGLLGYHALYFDLGLRVQPQEGESGNWALVALPFETKERDIESLHEVLQQETIAELIFGTAVKLGSTADRRTLEYAGHSSAALLAVHAEILEKQSGPDHTLVKLKFDRPLAGEEGYLRVRFRVSRSRRFWKWNRSIFAKNGALLDFRVSDRREAATVQTWRDLKPITIPRLYTFVITPSDFQMVSVSPPLHYMRLMEGGAWHRYLNRRSAFFGAGRLLIYEWRNQVAAQTAEADGWRAINLSSPFRIFLDLRRDDSVLTPKAMLRPMLALALVAAVLLWVEPSVEELRDFSVTLLPKLSVAVVVWWLLKWVYRAIGQRQRIGDALKWLRGVGRWIDTVAFGGFLNKR